MKIAFFCSASNALDQQYFNLAQQFAIALAQNNHTLITGGANVGMMRKISEKARELNVKTIGIIPKVIFHKELADHRNHQLIITETMAERKQKIIEHADAFIALPGGFGTLDELSEVIVYKQLAIIDSPIVIFNFNGFYNNLNKQFEIFFENKFAKKKNRDLYLITDSIQKTFEYIHKYKPQQSIDFDWFKVNKENF